MKERLSHLYSALRDALTDADAAYVLRSGCAATGLLTRDLNQIIVSFKDEADSHVADMTDLWESVLGRKPLEVARRKEAYRADPRRCGSCARRAGQDSRATHVITARIQERLPSMPAFMVRATRTRFRPV
jgi:hypothetical protein